MCIYKIVWRSVNTIARVLTHISLEEVIIILIRCVGFVDLVCELRDKSKCAIQMTFYVTYYIIVHIFHTHTNPTHLIQVQVHLLIVGISPISIKYIHIITCTIWIHTLFLITLIAFKILIHFIPVLFIYISNGEGY